MSALNTLMDIFLNGASLGYTTSLMSERREDDTIVRDNEGWRIYYIVSLTDRQTDCSDRHSDNAERKWIKPHQTVSLLCIRTLYGLQGKFSGLKPKTINYVSSEHFDVVGKILLTVSNRRGNAGLFEPHVVSKKNNLWV